MSARNGLIAIGGNSLIRAGQRGTVAEQRANAHETARKITGLVAQGWRLVITHGNGPQVGAALLRSERAAAEAYTHPLDVCVATTQSEIGYFLQCSLEQELKKAGLKIPVTTVLTQVRVNSDDPAFSNPTKPIGPFYSQRVAEEKHAQLGWVMVEDSSRGYRRVVPSPEPVEILEMEIIREILGLGMIVIALGGGGIPVIVREDCSVEGVEAVIDKDRASALLASGLGLDHLIISTDVDRVYLNYRKPAQHAIDRASSAQMRQYCQEGHFAAGSMGPKIESAARFLDGGGKEVIITSFELLDEAVNGTAGTHITR